MQVTSLNYAVVSLLVSHKDIQFRNFEKLIFLPEIPWLPALWFISRIWQRKWQNLTIKKINKCKDKVTLK